MNLFKSVVSRPFKNYGITRRFLSANRSGLPKVTKAKTDALIHQKLDLFDVRPILTARHISAEIY